MSKNLEVQLYRELQTELAYAGKIISAMLQEMAPEQKRRSHAAIDAAGVPCEGMTRAHERRDVLDRASAIAAAESFGRTVPPAGWKLVPIEPTDNMVIDGFESVPDRFVHGDNYPDEYDNMSGCRQAAFRAKRCYAAMLAAAPAPAETGSKA